MNCDEVFAILTRGPFPTGGEQDEAVEIHLRFCAECRQIAEALRPSDKLLRESVGINEGHDLPGYWGDPPSMPREAAVSISRLNRYSRVQRAGHALRGRSSVANLNVWQFGAAVALGIVFAAALRSFVAAHAPPLRSFDSIASDSASRPIRHTKRPENDEPALAGLKAVCRFGYTPQSADSLGPDDPPISGLMAVSRANTSLCCTQCHHPGSQVLAGADAAARDDATIRIVNSCTACHEW